MRARQIAAIALILLGLWLLLERIGLLPPGRAWGVFWSIVLIGLGLLLLLRTERGREAPGREASVPVVHDGVPLDGATRGRITIKHGAGRLQIQAGEEESSYLVWGLFGGGVKKTVSRLGDLLDVELAMEVGSVVDRMASFSGKGGAYEWNIACHPRIPVELILETGASDQYIDLTRVCCTSLDIKTGASSTMLLLPAQAGFTTARIQSGAARVKVSVPAQVALRINGSISLGSLKVDENRFPKTATGYESPGFAEAENRVELILEGGAGTVEIA